MTDDQRQDDMPGEEAASAPSVQDPAALHRDALIDRWFSAAFAGTRLTPPNDAWADLVAAKENLKQLLSHPA
jgi:hypothetical protein